MLGKSAKTILLLSMVMLLVMGGLAACSSQSSNGAGNDKSSGGNSSGAGGGNSDYPSKDITYMIPFNSGGQSDIAARRQQQPLEDILGVSINVTYKPGGGGAVGWSDLVSKEPTGYFMAGINIPHIILQPLLRDNAGYKTSQIEPVGLFQATPIGIAVQPDSGIKTLDDLISKAKESPGSITVAGSGKYSGHHMAFLQFQKLAGIKMTYVPFTGAAPQVKNFLGGHTVAIMANSNDLLKYKDKMNILAIGTEERFKPLPDVPTFKELGYDMTAGIQRGVAVPPGTDKEVIETLESAFLKVVKDPEFQKKMYKNGFFPMTKGAEETAKFIQSKKEQFMPILKELNLLK